jgi:hypothetical protein
LFAGILRYLSFPRQSYDSHVDGRQQKRNRATHIIVDGWTSPIDTSYLGCGIQWEQDAEVYFMVLEFIWYVFSTFARMGSDTPTAWTLDTLGNILLKSCMNA